MRLDNQIILSQSHYNEKILKRFEMLECCSVSIPTYGSFKLLPHVGSPIFNFHIQRHKIFDVCNDL